MMKIFFYPLLAASMISVHACGNDAHAHGDHAASSNAAANAGHSHKKGKKIRTKKTHGKKNTDEGVTSFPVNPADEQK